MDPDVKLEDLTAEVRKLSAADVEFAQRVALACCSLIKTKRYPLKAIRTVFRLEWAEENQS